MEQLVPGGVENAEGSAQDKKCLSSNPFLGIFIKSMHKTEQYCHCVTCSSPAKTHGSTQPNIPGALIICDDPKLS